MPDEIPTQPPVGGRRPFPVGLIAAFIAGGALFVIAVATWKAGPEGLGPSPDLLTPGPTVHDEGLERSGNEADLREWLAAADEKADAFGYGFGGMAVRTMALEANVGAPMPTAIADMAPSDAGQKAEVERVSGTNVQVSGIDEPDILKTDGERIFFAPQTWFRPWLGPVLFRGAPEPSIDVDVVEEGTSGSGTAAVSAMPSEEEPVSDKRMIAPMPERQEPTVKVIDAFPPESLAVASEIDRTGEMLLHDGTLAVFSHDGIFAYDVSDPASPSEKWSYDYEKDHGLVTARLKDGIVYAVLRSWVDRGRPCPIVPLSSAGSDVIVPCGDVWHPRAPVPSDATYTVVAIDASTGATRSAVSFVGSWDSSALYMSADSIYATWTVPPDIFDFTAAFTMENSDIFPSTVVSRVRTLASIDISDRAKLVELQVILEDWMRGLDDDARLMIENDLSDRGERFMKAHQRDYQRTGIVRIGVEGLDVLADGTVPGSLLNQFSMDEHAGHLRVATTVGGRRGFGWQFGFGGTDASVNDVYVLDADLNTTGSVTDLGEGERIYSARFVGDEGYVVTFRETDPFYVIDLSDPKRPRKAGELKIPGYSSYLHPVTDDLILGVGKEENKVKLSLFDVSDPASPRETAKYTLEEYWSDVLSTHHAFLLDADKGVFFMPGGKGGYVFSYGPASLDLVKAVSGVNARRALYVNDYLYVVGDDRIVVLDQRDWGRVNELDLME